jgi:hypothetical protein
MKANYSKNFLLLVLFCFSAFCFFYVNREPKSVSTTTVAHTIELETVVDKEENLVDLGFVKSVFFLVSKILPARQ